MPPLLVAELRVDAGADRAVEVVRGDLLQRGKRALARHLEFRERGLVEERGRLAHRPVLAPDRIEPAGLLLEARRLATRRLRRCRTRAGAPSRPSSRRPRRSPSAHRRAGFAARRARLSAPPPASGSNNSRRRIRSCAPRDSAGSPGALEKRRMSNGQRSMPGSPSRIQCAIASPAPPEAAMPAVKPQATKKFVELRREPHHRLAVGGDRDRSVDQRLDADLVQDRQALRRAEQDRLEALEVLREKLAREVERHALAPAGGRVLLPAADGEGADVGLQVEDAVGIAEGRRRVASCRASSR